MIATQVLVSLTQNLASVHTKMFILDNEYGTKSILGNAVAFIMLRFFCHRAIFREIGKVVLLIWHVVLYITNAILCKQHQVIPGRMPYNRIDMLKYQVVLIQEILQKL